MSKVRKLSLFSGVFIKCLAGWLPSWWCCGLSHCVFGMFPFLISVCRVQQLPKCCIAEPLECWNCLGWRTCLHCCHFIHTVWVGLLVYLSWELSYYLDAKSWPHCTREELAESWQSCSGNHCLLDCGWSKVRLAATSKLSWSQVTACSLFVPHSSSGSIPPVFFLLPCNCQSWFFSHQHLMFLVRQTVPVRRY